MQSSNFFRSVPNYTEQAQELKKEIQENVQNLAHDLRDRSEWLRNNYSKAIGVAGVLTVATIATYFILRRKKED